MSGSGVGTGRIDQPPRPFGHGGLALMLAPGSAFYLLFFGVPMLSLFVLSFWQAQGFDLKATAYPNNVIVISKEAK